MVDLHQLIQQPFTIAGARFPNRIWLASGTCGFGEEISKMVDLNRLGGICLKGSTLEPRAGNQTPRIAETPSGMLNAIGLENPGIDILIRDKIPYLRSYHVPVIVNFSGNTIEEYAAFAKRLSDETDVEPVAKLPIDSSTTLSDSSKSSFVPTNSGFESSKNCASEPIATVLPQTQVSAVEVNISCPNVKKGGMSFGTDPESVEAVIRAVKRHSRFPVIAKLSPNVTDIGLIARAAEAGGADALSLINTVLGMAFDIRTQQPKLANGMGGLSGPAIRPIAIRMVYQVRQVTSLPIIGMGGIGSLSDVFEFLIAGATAVQIGTLTFTDIAALRQIIDAANGAL